MLILARLKAADECGCRAAVWGKGRIHTFIKCIIFYELFFASISRFAFSQNNNFRHHRKCLNDSNVQEVDNFRIKPSKHTVITRFLRHVLILVF